MMGFRATHFSLLHQLTHRWQAWRGLLLALLALLSMGEAAANCTYSVNASPAYPTTFYVNPTRNLTSPFFTTTLTYRFRCAAVPSFGASNEALIFYFDAESNVKKLFGPITGVSVSTGTITITPQTTTTCSGFRYNNNTVVSLTDFFATGTTSSECVFNVAIPLSYFTNGDAYSFTNGVPNTSSTANLIDNRVAQYFILNGSSIYGTHTGTAATGLNSFSMVALNKTCVATAGGSQTVGLPSVTNKTASLNRNTGAGYTTFKIGVIGCSLNSAGTAFAYTLKAQVKYTIAQGTGPGQDSLANPLWIANTAATPKAANVYVLLLNANGDPIANDGFVDMTQNGDTTFSAQYMTTVGKTAGVGAVKGTFTLTFSYQ